MLIELMRTLKNQTIEALGRAFDLYIYLLVRSRLIFLLPRGRRHELPAPLIVTLTSYPPRFESLNLTLRSLLAQSVLPDRIILWIAEADISKLSQDILATCRDRIEIRTCPDLKPYKKLIPAIKEFPGSFLVSADDDTYYWRTWLEELTSAYVDPRTAICHFALKIRRNEKGLPLPYRKWDLKVRANESSEDIFPIGCHGVLYPPGIFAAEVLNEELFMALAPQNDDIWWYWMVRRKSGKFMKIGPRRRQVMWPNSQHVALWKSNVITHGNDSQITNMLRHFESVT